MVCVCGWGSRKDKERSAVFIFLPRSNQSRRRGGGQRSCITTTTATTDGHFYRKCRRVVSATQSCPVPFMVKTCFVRKVGFLVRNSLTLFNMHLKFTNWFTIAQGISFQSYVHSVFDRSKYTQHSKSRQWAEEKLYSSYILKLQFMWILFLLLRFSTNWFSRK